MTIPPPAREPLGSGTRKRLLPHHILVALRLSSSSPFVRIFVPSKAFIRTVGRSSTSAGRSGACRLPPPAAIPGADI